MSRAAGTPGSALSRTIAGLAPRLVFVTGLSMAIAAILSLFLTISQFERGMRPLVTQQVDAAIAATSREVSRALDLGIPLEYIGGLGDFLDEQARAAPGVARIELTAPGDAPETSPADPGPVERFAAALTHLNGGAPLPQVVSRDLTRADGTVGAVIHSTIDRDYVADLYTNILFDGFVIFVAGLLIALELISALVWISLGDPLRLADRVLRARAGGDLGAHPVARRPAPVAALLGLIAARSMALREKAMALGSSAAEQVARHGLDRVRALPNLTITDARVPLFVFCFGEELQKSFLPLYVAELWRPTDLFDQTVMTGLPISVFMFVIAAVTPFAAGLVERFGNRRLFLGGLVPAVAGYAVCALAQDGNQIVMGRAITALGYGVITISAQSYIALASPPKERARAMATFVGVLMAATMCGTAIGGILADWIGFRQVFWLMAAIGAGVGLLGFAMLRYTERTAPKPGAKSASAAALWRNPRFAALVLFCAIPTKIVLTGILYLYVPLYLAALDASQSEIGRIMMIYSLVIIPLSPFAAGQSDRLGAHVVTVSLATVASGAVLLGLMGNPAAFKALAVVTAIGVAHSFVKAPLIAGAMEAAKATPEVPLTAALGMLRTAERVGSVAGPIIVAALLVDLSFGTVGAIVGITIAIAGAILLITNIGSRGDPAAA